MSALPPLRTFRDDWVGSSTARGWRPRVNVRNSGLVVYKACGHWTSAVFGSKKGKVYVDAPCYLCAVTMPNQLVATGTISPVASSPEASSVVTAAPGPSSDPEVAALMMKRMEELRSQRRPKRG